ncbi:hypothetical protein D910_09260 [Dendroctonus ponderosae]|uniref:Large ribosomal subunit protein eL39 n=1 Tax=Dendroctonus ponderosae TaxID=77166 RepID=U4UFZ0_DENPD|nr:hypothetical protein D910_09260 [Dendroctonus ponderosae]
MDCCFQTKSTKLNFLLPIGEIGTDVLLEAVVLAPNIFARLEGVEAPKILPVKVCENDALGSDLVVLSALPTPFVLVASCGLITSLRNEKSALTGLVEKPEKLPKALLTYSQITECDITPHHNLCDLCCGPCGQTSLFKRPTFLLAAHKTFIIKRKLAKKLKQNRPIPQWVRMRTGNTIRYNAKRRHWRRTKLKL